MDIVVPFVLVSIIPMGIWVEVIPISAYVIFNDEEVLGRAFFASAIFCSMVSALFLSQKIDRFETKPVCKSLGEVSIVTKR